LNVLIDGVESLMVSGMAFQMTGDEWEKAGWCDTLAYSKLHTLL